MIIPLGVCIAVATCGLVGIVFVPESARYLVSKCKYQAVEHSLIRFGEIHCERTLKQLIAKTQFEENARNIGFGEMFQDCRDYNKTIVGVAMMGLQLTMFLCLRLRLSTTPTLLLLS